MRFSVSTKSGEKFYDGRDNRDQTCIEKDKILVPVVQDFIKARPPEALTALLMPALYGPEVYLLQEHGVPMSNLFVLEREKSIHKEILECKDPDRQSLKGMNTTRKPVDSVQGIQEVFGHPTCPFDIIYLDYFSYPDENHYDGVFKAIFKGELLKPDGLLILTFGKNRTRAVVKQFNKMLAEAARVLGFQNNEFVKKTMEFGVFVGLLIEAATSRTKYQDKFQGFSALYRSSVFRYCTTVMAFNVNEDKNRYFDLTKYKQQASQHEALQHGQLYRKNQANKI